MSIIIAKFFAFLDKHYASFVELENRLSKADFGENHVPVDPVSKLKSELELFMPLDEQVKVNVLNTMNQNSWDCFILLCYFHEITKRNISKPIFNYISYTN